MWSNFHTHSHYCDGKGAMTDYLDAAQKTGMNNIGFSSHAPIPLPCKWCMKAEELPTYLQEIESSKGAFSEMEIYKGLEIDFIPGLVSPADFSSLLDYTIGSVHFVESFEGKHWEIDNTLEVFKEGLSHIFNNNVRAAITRYFELTREMLLNSPPDILGHFDKIKMHNQQETFYEESETWYQEEVEKTLNVIRDSGVIVETNTRGIYKKKSSTTYPSPWILKRLSEKNIPITLSSDAHHPDDLTREFQPTAVMLRNIGFKNLTVLKNGIWKEVPFNEHGLVF